MSAFKVNDDQFDVTIGKLPTESIEVQKRILRKGANALRKNVKKNLKRSKISKTAYKHMVDDIQVSVRKDKDGDYVARVRGGKKTGRKWHLVNDGTYKTDATHFMDRSIAESDAEIEAIIDEELSRWLG
ncbi:HK97-gp10 family putative phage morphogenesis protein [Clostridium sp. UBA2485]|uniref:HK97-gp10 family putative phage morphogenesis protein n=1 Tax=Clostridium sp. UBA2485 TaxID=1946352 RepID=UPI0025BD8656|nr:HK97-gp10 family putative phage morphogenesis protein [Clostridium sp. UBA2485]